MLACRECQQPLVAVRDRGDTQWVCPKCRMRVFALAALDRVLQVDFARTLRDELEQGKARTGESCPACGRTMREVSLAVNAVELDFDACRPCGYVQLAAGVFEQLPRKARYEAAADSDARRTLASDRIRFDDERRRERRRWSDDLSDLSWPSRILMWIGLPVDADAEPSSEKPLLTWSIAGALVLAFLFQLAAGDEVIAELAWIPAQPFRLGGLTLITSFFLHSGWFHLLGNLYFLLAFGPGVERKLGVPRTALLIGAADLLGNVAHAAFDPRRELPCIGASGGLSALILYYAASFPWNRFAVIVWFTIVPRRFVVPAVMWAALWFAWQLLLAFVQHFGGGSVSAFAHLGGALAGIGAWIAWRKRGDVAP